MIAEFVSSLLPWASLENPSTSLNDPDAYDYLVNSVSESGIAVTPRTAMTLAPVWQGLSILSGDIAAATANVYKRLPENDREIDTAHEADFLISTRPNDEVSAFDLWRRLIVHTVLWQNGYLYIEKQGGVGKPKGLYNLLPDRTGPARDKAGNLFYVTEVDGRPEPLAKEQVFHLRGLSLDLDKGYELFCAARDSWGLSLAAQGYGSKFFANGAQAGGLIEIPPTMTDLAADKLAEGLKKKHTGKDNWFKMMVLRDGAKFHNTTIDAEKSQLTELRDAQVAETARFLNMAPHKLGLKDSVSYNSAEQAQIQYITGCLTHWFAAIRGEAQIKFLTDKQQRSGSHFIDFNISKLIERDVKTTVEILEIERRNEIINAAEWRRKRNLPPRTDPAALEYMNPNTKSNPEPPTDEEPEDEPQSSNRQPPKNAMSAAVRGVCEDAIKRITRRVTSHARNAAKHPDKLIAWLDSKGHEHRDIFHEIVLPAATLAAEVTQSQGDDVCYAWGGKFFSGIVSLLDTVTKPPYSSTDLEANVNEQCVLFEAAVCHSLLGNLIGSEENASVTETAA